VIIKKNRKLLGTCDVIFQCDPPGASDVALVCDALRWEPFPMHRVDGRGPFQARLGLRTGEATEFRYLIDGTWWINDDTADGYIPNDFGSENSVVVARSSASRANIASLVAELEALRHRIDTLCGSLEQLLDDKPFRSLDGIPDRDLVLSRIRNSSDLS
jgi:hypothetical protein